MTLRSHLVRIQRNFVAAVLICWLASVVGFLLTRPSSAVLVFIAAAAAVIASGVYLYISARCPICDAKLWLSLQKLAPFGSLRPRLNHCPSCGVPAGDSAEA